MPVKEHNGSCPYCNELITVFIDIAEETDNETLADLSLDQQQDCPVCCRPIYIRMTSQYFNGNEIEIELISENDVY